MCDEDILVKVAVRIRPLFFGRTITEEKQFLLIIIVRRKPFERKVERIFQKFEKISNVLNEDRVKVQSAFVLFWRMRKLPGARYIVEHPRDEQVSIENTAARTHNDKTKIFSYDHVFDQNVESARYLRQCCFKDGG